MRGHNLPLPRHLFGCVAAEQVCPTVAQGRPAIPCVWFAVSVDAGRGLGCHLLTEDGALIAEVPLGALWLPEGPLDDWIKARGAAVRIRPPHDGEWWDSPGNTAELTELPYLDGLVVRQLDGPPTRTGGRYLFTLDHLGDGYSRHADQHKLLHAIAFPDGAVILAPTDRLLWIDAAFTVDRATAGVVPRVRRQPPLPSIERARLLARPAPTPVAEPEPEPEPMILDLPPLGMVEDGKP